MTGQAVRGGIGWAWTSGRLGKRSEAESCACEVGWVGLAMSKGGRARTARSGWAFCTGGLGFSWLTMRLWTVSGAFLFLGGYGLGWMSWVATW